MIEFLCLIEDPHFFYFQSKVQITAVFFVHFSTLELVMFLVVLPAQLGVCLVPTKKYIFNETIIYCILLNMGPATALNTSMHLNSSHNDWCYNSWAQVLAASPHL